MRSHDAGNTWEKTVVWLHPHPHWDWSTSSTNDTVFTCDRSSSIVIDRHDQVHIAFGIDYLYHPQPGPAVQNPFPADGIGYWRSDMPAFPGTHRSLHPDTLNQAGKLIGWTQDFDNNGQLNFMPDWTLYGPLK